MELYTILLKNPLKELFFVSQQYPFDFLNHLYLLFQLFQFSKRDFLFPLLIALADIQTKNILNL